MERRQVLAPTLLGWVAIVVLSLAPFAGWWLFGESFLAVTNRAPGSELIIIEGWIGTDALRGAALECSRDPTQVIVVTGGFTTSHWTSQRWNYATMAARELTRSGIPLERIILAPTEDQTTQRTYEMAVAVGNALAAHHLHPKSANVFTRGPHARRSRLVFAKALHLSGKVGVISWSPPEYASKRWWQSSERAADLVKETAGFFYEALFSSGRQSFLDSSSSKPPLAQSLPTPIRD